MARKTVPVDRDALVAAIAHVEGKDGYSGGKTEMCKAAAEQYNKVVNPSKPITHSVVYLRIEEFKIPIKTKAKKRGRGKMTDEQKAAMQAGRAASKGKTKAQKFAADPVAQRNFQLLRDRTPERFHPVIDKVEEGSRTAAVKLACLECSNFQTVEIRECPCEQCPLFMFRPYQGKSNEGDYEEPEAKEELEPMEEAA